MHPYIMISPYYLDYTVRHRWYIYNSHLYKTITDKSINYP